MIKNTTRIYQTKEGSTATATFNVNKLMIYFESRNNWNLEELQELLEKSQQWQNEIAQQWQNQEVIE